MIINISSIQFDPLGNIQLDILEDQSDFGETRRRVNRISTLDGGAVFNDFGFSEADKTFTLVWNLESREQARLVKRLIILNSFVRISTPDGVFVCAPENFSSTQEQGTLTLLVKSKED
jgi:hypothetical protein